MKKIRKLITLLFAIILITAFNPINAHAEWRRDSYGWWNTEGDSWSVGWRLIDGKWYYFYSNGYMAHDTFIGIYYVNSSGEWVPYQPSTNTNSINNSVNNTNNNTYKNDNISYKSQESDTSKDEEKTASSNHKLSQVDEDEENNDELDEEDNDEDADVDDKDEDDNDEDEYTYKYKKDYSSSYYDYSRKSSSEVYVRGYYRKGKYVKPHYRTKRDKTTKNNYSHKGNINPHTGKRGYKK